MVKIWAKTVKDQKMVKQFTLQEDRKMQWSDFWDHVSNICYNMDIATPVVMKSHLFNYAKYNYVKFDKSDFVETVDFDFLIIENVDR